MTKAQWKTRIRAATKSVGTYRKEFDSVVDTLAGIMEKRDAAQDEWEAAGSVLIVEHENAGGAVNKEKNPLVVLINELNRDALVYWRDLGLTPAGLKKIDEAKMKATKEKNTGLVAALEAMGG